MSTSNTDPSIPPVPKFYSFIHNKTITVQGRDDNYVMSERHMVIENGERSEYTKEFKYADGTSSMVSERGDPSVVNKVSAVNDKFLEQKN